jgi:hypothetical protein
MKMQKSMVIEDFVESGSKIRKARPKAPPEQKIQQILVRGHHFSGKAGCGEGTTATQRYSFRVDSNSGAADQWLSLDGGRMR